MGDDAGPDERVPAAMLSGAIGGAVMHPLVADLDDDHRRDRDPPDPSLTLTKSARYPHVLGSLGECFGCGLAPYLDRLADLARDPGILLHNDVHRVSRDGHDRGVGECTSPVSIRWGVRAVVPM